MVGKDNVEALVYVRVFAPAKFGCLRLLSEFFWVATDTSA